MFRFITKMFIGSLRAGTIKLFGDLIVSNLKKNYKMCISK